MTVTTAPDGVVEHQATPRSSRALPGQEEAPDEANWWKSAYCRWLPLSLAMRLFFPDPKVHYPSAAVTQMCQQCPVRVQCLDHALFYPEAFGVWGGTTPYQRTVLRRARVRQRCPCCGGTELRRGPIEICLLCGISWSAVRLEATQK